MKKLKKFFINTGVFLVNTLCKVLMFAVLLLALAVFAVPFGLLAIMDGIGYLASKERKEKKHNKLKAELEDLRQKEIASLELVEFDYIKRHSGNVATKEKTMVDAAEEIIENIGKDDLGV